MPAYVERELASGCGAPGAKGGLGALACVVVAAHSEDTRWTRAFSHLPVIIYARTARRGAELGRPVVSPNVFKEAAVFLWYIVAFYDRLPRLTFFLHGHNDSWHNRFSKHPKSPPHLDFFREETVRQLAASDQVYRSFNDLTYYNRFGPKEWRRWLAAQRPGYERLLQPTIGTPPSLAAYCCSQFVVSAARIRGRPLAFWRTLLAALLDVKRTPRLCVPSSHLLEIVWGVLLGEPAEAPCHEAGWGAPRLAADPAVRAARLKSLDSHRAHAKSDKCPDWYRPR